MTQIAISDEVASSLASAATARGCTQDQLASILIEDGLRREEEYELTPAQEARILESVEQAKRGEIVDGDIVMARFDNGLKEIASS
jgi:predicted transcriptional regulator